MLSWCCLNLGMLISMDLGTLGVPSRAERCRGVSGCLQVACIWARIEATALVWASPCTSPFKAAMFVVFETVAFTDLIMFEAATVESWHFCFSAFCEWFNCLSLGVLPSHFTLKKIQTLHFTLPTPNATLHTPTPPTLPTSHSKVYNGMVRGEEAQ